jgi:hypothetical protein
LADRELTIESWDDCNSSSITTPFNI